MSQTIQSGSGPTPPTPGAEQKEAWASTGYIPYNPDVSNSAAPGASQNTQWVERPIFSDLSYMGTPQKTQWQMTPELAQIYAETAKSNQERGAGTVSYSESVDSYGNVWVKKSTVPIMLASSNPLADFVINGVEKFVNGGQSESLSEMAAKGNNVNPWEKSQLQNAGYKLIDLNADWGVGDDSGQIGPGWSVAGVTAGGVPYYKYTGNYQWVKSGDTGTSLNPVGVLQTAFVAGENFGKDVIKPTLQDTGLYEPAKEVVYDLYNLSPIKYNSNNTTEETLKIAQSEGIPVTLVNGKFLINAQGSDYENYAGRMQAIQLNLNKKQNASIFGTGLTWDNNINNYVAGLLPKSWSPSKAVIDYENSGKIGSGQLKGITDLYSDWYNNKVAVAPVNVLTEIGGEAAIGAVTGAAVKGGTILLRTGMEGASGLLDLGAEAISSRATAGILDIGAGALSAGSEVEASSIAGRALSAVVNSSGKVAAAADISADVLSTGAKVLSVGSRYVEPAANALMTGGVVSDVASSKSYKEGVGKIVGLAVGGIGYKAGSEGVIKAYDVARTSGLSEIPIEDIADAKVLSGQNKFPLIEKGSNATDVIKAFDAGNGVSKGYHGTPVEFKAETETPNPRQVPRHSDMPGLYVSPEKKGPSVLFTRVGDNGANPYIELAKGVKETASGIAHLNPEEIKSGAAKSVTAVVGGSTPLKPAILHIELSKGVERLPQEARFDYGKAEKVYRANAGTGKTFLTPVLEKSLAGGGGPEAEAVISPGTKLTKTGSEGYISFNNRRIPVVSYVTGEGKSGVSSEVSKELPTGHNEFRDMTNEVISAKDLKKSYSYEPVKSKGILSDVGFSFIPGYNNPTPSIIESGSSISSIRGPAVNSVSGLQSNINQKNNYIAPGLTNVISELETHSGSEKYNRTLPDSSSLIPKSRGSTGPSSPIRLLPSNISPGSKISRLTPSVPGPGSPSRISPESIISGLTPSNPGPGTPSRISPESIISGLTPSNPGPTRGGGGGSGGGGSFSGVSSSIFRPIPSINRSTDIISSGSNPGRSISHVSISGTDFIPNPGGNKPKPKDDNQKKQLIETGLSGTVKHGQLKNKFGDIDKFSKKAMSGNKLGFKKIKF